MLSPKVSAFISIIDSQVDAMSTGLYGVPLFLPHTASNLNKEVVRAQAKAAGQPFKPANEHLYLGIRGTCQS